MTIWAWDARPYPAFPAKTEIWSDGLNWYTGHWLNGRLGRLRLADLIADLCRTSGLQKVDVREVYGVIDGYVLADANSARGALEALLGLYNISVHENSGSLIFRSQGEDAVQVLNRDHLIVEDGQTVLAQHRDQVSDLPVAVSLQHIDEAKEYSSAETAVRRTNGSTLQEHTISLPVTASSNVVESVLENWLRSRWTARDQIVFALARNSIGLTTGDLLQFDDMQYDQVWQITRVEESEQLRISAKAVEPGEIRPLPVDVAARAVTSSGDISSPLVHFLDLPFISSADTQNSNLIAVRSDPWPGPMAVYSSPGTDGFVFRQSVSSPATLGELEQALPPSKVIGRWQSTLSVELKLFDEAIFSEPDISVFSGANALAVRSNLGSWEILQFRDAEPLGNDVRRISGFLRGQKGTEPEAEAGSDVGASVVLLDAAVVPLLGSASENELLLNWLIGPAGGLLGDPEFTSETYASGVRGLLPFRPVHLKAVTTSAGDLELSWIRQDRL